MWTASVANCRPAAVTDWENLTLKEKQSPEKMKFNFHIAPINRTEKKTARLIGNVGSSDVSVFPECTHCIIELQERNLLTIAESR